jgi:hypothetical protein
MKPLRALARMKTQWSQNKKHFLPRFDHSQDSTEKERKRKERRNGRMDRENFQYVDRLHVRPYNDKNFQMCCNFEVFYAFEYFFLSTDIYGIQSAYILHNIQYCYDDMTIISNFSIAHSFPESEAEGSCEAVLVLPEWHKGSGLTC